MERTVRVKRVSAILSAILSFLFGAFCIYPVVLGHYLFLTFTLFCWSMVVAKVFLIIRHGVAIRHATPEERVVRENSALIPFGFIVLGTVIPLDFGLLFMMFVPTNGDKANWVIFGIFVVYGLWKSFLALFRKIRGFKEYSPLLEGLCLADINSAMYALYGALMLLLDLSWFSAKPIWMLIILVGINATITILSVATPLSSIMKGRAGANINVIQQAKEMKSWLDEHQIFFFVQIAFQFQLALIAFVLGFTQHWGFFALSFIYIVIAFFKIGTWIWRIVARKKYKDDEFRAGRAEHKMLILTAGCLVFIVAPSVFALYGLWNAGSATEIFWAFLILEIGFIVFKVIAEIISATKAIKGKDPFVLATNAYSTVLVGMTAFAVAATFAGFMDWPIPLWVIFIGIGVVVLLILGIASHLLLIAIRELRKKPE